MKQVEELLDEIKAKSISMGFSVNPDAEYFVTIRKTDLVSMCGHGGSIAEALENAKAELAKRCNPNKLPEPKVPAMPKPKAPAMPMPMPRTRA